MKRSRQPNEWLPPNGEFHCQYVKDWLKIKHQWELDFDCEESDELSRLVGGCL